MENYFLQGGKRWRAALFLMIAEALGKKVEDVLDFVIITEIVHNGTLVIDDIEDRRYSFHPNKNPDRLVNFAEGNLVFINW